MKMLVSSLFLAASASSAITAAPAAAQQRGDSFLAFEAMRQGRILPLREIERRVVPLLRGAQYIGFDFDSLSGIYTLKFLRDGTVIWVEVDGRSGQVVGRTDN